MFDSLRDRMGKVLGDRNPFLAHTAVPPHNTPCKFSKFCGHTCG